MIVRSGVGAAWNYTMGPAYFYRGRRSIDEIYSLRMPAVVVAERIPLADLTRIELTRVCGFVLGSGTTAEPEFFFYMSKRRATVIAVPSIVEDVRADDPIIVDGVSGTVYIQPDEPTIERYREMRHQGPPPPPACKLADLALIAANAAAHPAPQPELLAQNIEAMAAQFYGRKLTDEDRDKIRESVAATGFGAGAAAAGAPHAHEPAPGPASVSGREPAEREPDPERERRIEEARRRRRDRV